MKRCLTLLVLVIILPCLTYAQNNYRSSQERRETLINRHLDSIRDHPAMLRKFFQNMPKGGDLHHHYSGSVYAETYLEGLEKADAWINPKTLEIRVDRPKVQRESWKNISSLKKAKTWKKVKTALLKSWSILYYHYNGNNLPPDQHFFNSFGKFGPAKTSTLEAGLRKIKARAKKEHTLYIESMFHSIWVGEQDSADEKLNQTLLKLSATKSTQIQATLQALYSQYSTKPYYRQLIKKHHHFLDSLHQDLKIDDQDFMMRYQNYVARTTTPIKVFKDLLLCFLSAQQSKLIVGVNILAPENNEIALRDYWLHMQMFKFFRSKFPSVKCALHAGELVLGLVRPEELTWHIGEAVKIAKADRIGHGVGIMYETSADETLKLMQQKGIAVEINLSSNAFILGVTGKQHPITIYHQHNIPLVISTDDAGVLRTDLTEQYVILARDYPIFSYTAIKALVYNSIRYSFLEDAFKKKLTQKLRAAFIKFENQIIKKAK